MQEKLASYDKKINLVKGRNSLYRGEIRYLLTKHVQIRNAIETLQKVNMQYAIIESVYGHNFDLRD